MDSIKGGSFGHVSEYQLLKDLRPMELTRIKAEHDWKQVSQDI
jgi:hypothetical protein